MKPPTAFNTGQAGAVVAIVLALIYALYELVRWIWPGAM